MSQLNVCMNNHKGISIHIDDFSPFHRDQRLSLSLQISAYLRRLIVFNKHMRLKRFILPSLQEMTRFFQCSIFDMLKAMYDLKVVDYIVEVRGLQEPVAIENPVHYNSRYHQEN